jgi:hypothetical protein
VTVHIPHEELLLTTRAQRMLLDTIPRSFVSLFIDMNCRFCIENKDFTHIYYVARTMVQKGDSIYEK